MAPSRGLPSAYHCVVAFVGCGDHEVGASVSCWPTSGVPWMAGRTVGWSAPSALSGSPTPVEQEITAISPRFGLVMFGSNDVQARDVGAIDLGERGVARFLGVAAVSGPVVSLRAEETREEK